MNHSIKKLAVNGENTALTCEGYTHTHTHRTISVTDEKRNVCQAISDIFM